MRIVFTGGGSGGHLYPIIAVAREIRRIADDERILDLQLFYFGPEAIPSELARVEGVIARRIRTGKIRRYFSFLNLLDCFKIAYGVLAALWNMFVVMPDVVFVKGGYGSFPTALAARIYRLPVMVHESDAVPGRVNRWVGAWAARTAISFPGAASYFPEGRTALTGVPVRSRIIGANRKDAEEILGVFSGRPALFIIGGSQGATIINHAVVQVLKELLGRYEIIHQVGERNAEDVRLETAPIIEGGAELYYHLWPFLDEERLRAAYLIADLIIARAGATVIFEIAAAGKPAILIPLKNSAQDHQRENAYAYAGRGAAAVIDEENLTPLVLFHEIERLIADPQRRNRMAEAAKTFGRPEAAELIAREILTLGLH